MKIRNLILHLLFLACSCSENITEVSRLSQIPEIDRAKIEKLLSFLVWDEGFAYVLFGSKPMSKVCQDKTLPPSYLELYQSPILELESLWRTWEKYSHLFPMTEFIFLAESDERWFNVALFNKSNCLKAIEDNLTIFQEKIGSGLSPVEILDYITKSGNIFKKGLSKSQALAGILFGYGTENALGFEKYFSVTRDYLPKSIEHINTEDSGPLILPCFASFSEKETRKLTADYQKQREEILRIYSNKRFLEITIDRLTLKYDYKP